MNKFALKLAADDSIFLDILNTKLSRYYLHITLLEDDLLLETDEFTLYTIHVMQLEKDSLKSVDIVTGIALLRHVVEVKFDKVTYSLDKVSIKNLDLYRRHKGIRRYLSYENFEWNQHDITDTGQEKLQIFSNSPTLKSAKHKRLLSKFATDGDLKINT